MQFYKPTILDMFILTALFGFCGGIVIVVWEFLLRGLIL